MSFKPRILIAEDESGIADTLQYVLKSDGFIPVWCATAEEAIAQFAQEPPALAILDIGLPDLNGFELFKRLQALNQSMGGPEVPMVFLTARSDEIDRVVGLELGADDYIAKPFSPRELVARVRTILRRSARNGSNGSPAASPPNHGVPHQKPSQVSPPASQAPALPFLLDSERMQIRYYGRLLELSRYEYGLLRLLVQRPGACSRATNCCSSCGTTPATASTARSTRTSRRCAPSSRPSRRRWSRSARCAAPAMH
jgi:two-component system catabolic regulation response regulator CreB